LRKIFVKVTVEREIGGRTFSLTTGEIAKQASGAVLVQLGETVVFVAAQSGPPRPGIDFFPLGWLPPAAFRAASSNAKAGRRPAKS
jgi:hypothetical protein